MQVRVVTGARLHFGPLAWRADRGPSFGGVGAMIDAPGVVLTARSADRVSVDGRRETATRVERRVRRFREASQLPSAAEIEIVRSIPPHRGLGSGTQLALAVAAALLRLNGRTVSDAGELAMQAGRGERSAVGLHGFLHGGLIVDGGKRSTDVPGTLSAHTQLPEAWRIVLFEPNAAPGTHGKREEAAFRDLPATPERLTERLCRIVLTELLPAAKEHDVDAFGEAVYVFNRLVGEHFAAVQHGPYASERAGQLVGWLRDRGVRGVGQSSWGPTVFAFVHDEARGRGLIAALAAESEWVECPTRLVRPLNEPAAIAVEPG